MSIEGEDKPCDLGYLLGNLGGNMGAAKRLITMYLANHPNLLAVLDRATEAGDLRSIRQVVHDIRGSCVLFSARHCLLLTRRIEEALRAPADEIVAIESDEMPGWMKDCIELRGALVAMADELRVILARE